MNPASMHQIHLRLNSSRIAVVRCVFSALLLFGMFSGCFTRDVLAQNPFGEGATQTDDQAPLATDSAPLRILSSSNRLIIDSIASADLKTADQLVTAINTLFDIEADVEAKKYLARLAAIQTTDAQMHDLHRKTGTPFFIDLASRPGMQPEGRAYAEKVLDAAWRFAFDPRRLDSLTQQLDHKNIYNRSDALAQLKKTGESGAAAIINALNDPTRSKQFPFLRTALSKFGSSASQPLIGAVLSDNPALRLEAAQALGYVETRDARLALYHPFIAGRSGRIRSIAAESLKRHLGYVPEQAEIESELFKAARDYGAPAKIDPYEPESFKTVWRWKDGLQPQRIRADVAKHLMAARFAEALLFSRPEEKSYQQLYLVCALQSMKSAGGVDQPLDAAFADSIRRRFSSVQISEALRNSLERNLPAGAVAAAELLQQYNDDSVLQSSGGIPSPLAQAIQYGDQRVTHAAAQTISSLSLHQPFAGSSNYLTSLVFLSSSKGQRKALVAHSRVDVARTIADAVSRSGYVPVTVAGPRDVFNVATNDPDIELILISDTINRPDYLELIQMLRRDWRSRRIPIGIAYQESNKPRIEAYLRRDPLTIAIPETYDPAIIARQLSHIHLRAGIDELRPETRLEYGQWASNQLAALIGQESPAVKFDFAAHQETIAQGLFTVSTSAASSRVLGRVGTPFAQQQLISVAGQSGLPIEVRRTALDALSTAFETNGVLLTKDQILGQYEAYNNSASEPDESREILSSILDLFEKKK